MYQKTIRNSFTLDGIAVHSGNLSEITLHSAQSNTGIVFRRVDVDPYEIIEAKIGNVSNTERCTQLKNMHGYTVSMVEHTLSAVRGMGIDNVIIDVNGEELPIFDGSSTNIAAKISEVGHLQQEVKKTYLHLQQKIRVEHGNSFLEAHPSSTISYCVCFKNEHNIAYLADQTSNFNFIENNYLTDIAPARTFCFEKEIMYLQSKGLIQGASLEHGIVIGEERIYPNLRFHDELARHKLLDLIGDLALNPPFHANITGSGTSHYLNTLFAQELLNNLI
ncbi:UDP-3-O-acyl-N-acetylglucosamine deacetylase [Paenibacillus pabuli]|uniref:UDP-3-O-acyl-N-acetylglucosamine deacetylase n=1 Tax=Paenibacillus pabuli TaxID=1472 RepID=UPI001FFF8C3B|nr:UDP-3-O-acyl-N-acetylglucosamine deacetylase [Paenibacillus pabuli]UPK45055.1 UDP-3-O-[3-hydroxymyristoyl] N-acetylglucosamine deacetylase [Paenibacillus pabuli]